MKATKLVGSICIIVAFILLIADYNEDNSVTIYSLVIILTKVIGLAIGYIGIQLISKKKEV